LVDIDEVAVEHGRHLAEQRGLTEGVNLRCGDAKLRAPQRANAVVCIGASQVWDRRSRRTSRSTTPPR
jgi:hypothetical protein